MALVLDTGIIYAYYDQSDDWHKRAKRLMVDEKHGLILPSPVIAEVDHLLRNRISRAACRAFYAGLVDGSYMVADLPPGGYARVVELNRRYPDLGFVDAAVVAIAEARRVPRIATCDRRHFGPLAGPLALEILP